MPRGELHEIPRMAHFLAWDERRRKVVAYDVQHRFLGVLSSSAHIKRQGSACSLVDEPTLRRMPNYNLITDAIAAAWGPDWDRLLTNPPEYPNNPASVCVSSVPQTIVFDSSPDCTSTELESNAVSAQSAGSIALSYKQGTNTDMQMTVSEAAVFPVADVAIAGKVTMPSLAATMESFPADFTINNQVTKSASINKNSLRDTPVTATATSAGQTCNLALTNTTCTATGSGQIQVSATGYVWVNYPSPRGKDGDTHFKWAMSTDATIPDEPGRSSYIKFQSSVKTWGITRAAPQCSLVISVDRQGIYVNPGQSKSSAVLVAVPVVLGVIAVILGLVAYFVWRRRRSAKSYPNTLRSQPTDGSSSRGPQMSTYPEVTPMWLPPNSSVPPTSTPSHGRGPSIDQSAMLTVSSSHGHGIGGGFVNEKGRPITQPVRTHSDMFTPGTSSDIHDEGIMSPGGPLPPAYSESAGQSTVSAPQTHSTPSAPSSRI